MQNRYFNCDANTVVRRLPIFFVVELHTDEIAAEVHFSENPLGRKLTQTNCIWPNYVFAESTKTLFLPFFFFSKQPASVRFSFTNIPLVILRSFSSSNTLFVYKEIIRNQI